MITFSRLGKMGRLGHSLFQIASVMGIASKLGTTAAFPLWTYGRYFKTKLPRLHKNKPDLYEPCFHYDDTWFLDERDYVGWLQSEKYFESPAANSVATQDADIVSGMLTAIREAIKSFARDSFGSEQENLVNKLDIDDLEVWFEQGPRAVLAVVIRGSAPESLRTEHFIPACEAIHNEMREPLQLFDGDTEPFEIARPHLEECLQARYEAQTDPAKFKVPGYISLMALLILVALAVWGFFSWRSYARWCVYLG